MIAHDLISLQSIYFLISEKISSVSNLYCDTFRSNCWNQMNRSTSLTILRNIRYDSRKKREAIFATGSSVNPFSLITFSFMENNCCQTIEKLLTHPSDRRVQRRWRDGHHMWCPLTTAKYIDEDYRSIIEIVWFFTNWDFKYKFIDS